MDWYKTLILILFGLSSISCSHFSFREYFYISSPKTWEDAQLYCREKYTDLATFESIEEVNQLNRPTTISGWVWFGLHDDPMSWKGTLGNDSNSWRWSTTGQRIMSNYHNWKDGEPTFWEARRFCAFLEYNSQWRDADCNRYRIGSFCYNDIGQNQKTYVFIPSLLNWYQAQAYCREHHTDLALITSAEENAMVVSISTNFSWIGLYRIPWTWSDMSPLHFTNWLAGQPNNYYQNEHCAAEDENHQWADFPCSHLNPFICYEVRESKNTMKMKMKTTADLTDPVVQEQILQKLDSVCTSRGWTNFRLQWTTRPQKTQMELP